VIDYITNLIVIDDYFRDFKNIHSTSMGDEPPLWWLSFLVYHRLLWLCLRGGYFPICVR